MSPKKGPNRNPGLTAAKRAAEKAHEEELKALKLAKQKEAQARRLAKAEHRSASYESTEALNESPRKTVYKQNHETGKFDITGDMPSLEDKNDIVLKGSTDAQWFSFEKRRTSKWYKELAEDAKHIQSLRGHIKSNLKGAEKSTMEAMIDFIVEMKSDHDKRGEKFSHTKWVDSLKGAGFSREQVFGSRGLYNYILSFRRAASIVDKKGATVRRRLALDDFRKDPKDKYSKFKSIELSLYPREKGEKYRTTEIKARDIKKAAETQPSREELVKALAASLENTALEHGMTVKVSPDGRRVYVRQEGKAISVVNIGSVMEGTKVVGYKIKDKFYKTASATAEAAKKIIKAQSKKNAEKVNSKEATKRLSWADNMRKWLKNDNVRSKLKSHGYDLIDVPSGFHNYAIDGETVRVKADFKFNHQGSEYLIRVNGDKAVIEVHNLIIAHLDNAGLDKKKGSSGVFKLAEFSVTSLDKMLDEFRELDLKRRNKLHTMLKNLVE